MKKSILGIALLTISFFSLPAVAQSTANTTPGNITKEKVMKKDKPGKGDFKGKKGAKPGCCSDSATCAFDPFNGITLSDAQKAQVKQIAEKRQAARKAKTDKMKAEKQARSDAKKIQRTERDSLKRAERQNYLTEIKGVLTPDQYVVFLENIVVNGGDKAKMNGAPRQGKDFKGKMAQKGNKQKGQRKGGKDQRPAPAAQTPQK